MVGRLRIEAAREFFRCKNTPAVEMIDRSQSFGRDWRIWREIIAGIVEDRIVGSASTNFSMFITDELSTFTLSKIRVGQPQIAVLAELIAFDQIGALDLLLGFGIDALHPDAMTGLRIDLVKPDRVPLVFCIPQGDRA